MKILFVLRLEIIPEVGGIERVTHVLAQYFSKEGIEVNYLYYTLKSISCIQSHQGINVYFLPKPEILESIENQNFIRNIIENGSIDIVLNQGGMAGNISRLLQRAVKGTDSRLISTWHNMPYGYKLYRRIFINSLKSKPFSVKTFVKKIIATPLSMYYHRQFLNNSRISIKSSDIFVVLSDSYKDLMYNIFKVNKSNRIIAIPNPLSFNVTFSESDFLKKKKQVLYVGRLEYSQKRIDRLIEAWSNIEDEVSDWKLVIVGGDGGDEKEIGQRLEFHRLKNLVKSLHLKNVEFVGSQDPQPYYMESQIFCLTSSYEGFGMVLIEAMQFGVVPMAFGSYSAVFDILTHKENGLIIDPFNIDEYAKNLKKLIREDGKRMDMAREAINSSRKFSIENTGNQWVELFYELKNHKYKEINN